MFYECKLRPASVMAAVFWVLGWSAAVAQLFFDDLDFGHIGVGFMAGACILQVRGYYLSIRKRFDEMLLDSEIRELRQERPIHRIR